MRHSLSRHERTLPDRRPCHLLCSVPCAHRVSRGGGSSPALAHPTCGPPPPADMHCADHCLPKPPTRCAPSEAPPATLTGPCTPPSPRPAPHVHSPTAQRHASTEHERVHYAGSTDWQTQSIFVVHPPPLPLLPQVAEQEGDSPRPVRDDSSSTSQGTGTGREEKRLVRHGPQRVCKYQRQWWGV